MAAMDGFRIESDSVIGSVTVIHADGTVTMVSDVQRVELIAGGVFLVRTHAARETHLFPAAQVRSFTYS